jgi:hypothetical protein
MRNMAQGVTVATSSGGPAFLGNSRLGWVGGGCVIYMDFVNQINLGCTNLGVAELISKGNYNGGKSHYLNYSHNLIGCPESELWFAAPSTFANVSVTDNGSTLTINAGTTGCEITACSGNNGAQCYFRAFDVSNCTFPTSIRPIYVTVTKPNYLPYTAVVGNGTFSATSIGLVT